MDTFNKLYSIVDVDVELEQKTIQSQINKLKLDKEKLINELEKKIKNMEQEIKQLQIRFDEIWLAIKMWVLGIFSFDQIQAILNSISLENTPKIMNLEKKIKNFKKEMDTKKNAIEKKIEILDKKLKSLKPNILEFDLFKEVSFSRNSETFSFASELPTNKNGSVFSTKYLYDSKYAKLNTLKCVLKHQVYSISNIASELTNSNYPSNENGTFNKLDTIKAELTKYFVERHRLRIKTETNIFEYYDLINYDIKKDENNIGVFPVECEFIQNVNFKDNLDDIVYQGEIKPLKIG